MPLVRGALEIDDKPSRFSSIWKPEGKPNHELGSNPLQRRYCRTHTKSGTHEGPNPAGTAGTRTGKG